MSLRDQIVEALRGEGAHAGFGDSVSGLDPALQGKRPPGSAHSPWELIEHLRLAQRDILEYTRGDEGYEEREFPSGYWPSSPEPPDAGAWERSVEAFRKDLREFCDFVGDEANDLAAPLPQSKSGASILSQALMTADHNAYHLGQLVLVRRLLGAWKG